MMPNGSAVETPDLSMLAPPEKEESSAPDLSMVDAADTPDLSMVANKPPLDFEEARRKGTALAAKYGTLTPLSAFRGENERADYLNSVIAGTHRLGKIVDDVMHSLTGEGEKPPTDEEMYTAIELARQSGLGFWDILKYRNDIMKITPENAGQTIEQIYKQDADGFVKTLSAISNKANIHHLDSQRVSNAYLQSLLDPNDARRSDARKQIDDFRKKYEQHGAEMETLKTAFLANPFVASIQGAAEIWPSLIDIAVNSSGAGGTATMLAVVGSYAVTRDIKRSLKAGIKLAKVAFPSAVAAYSTKLELGGMMTELLTMKDENGKYIDIYDPTVAATALSFSALAGGMEVLKLKTLLKTFPFARKAMDKAILKTVTSPSFKQAVREGGKVALKGGTIQAGQEGVQAFFTTTGQELIKHLENEFNDAKFPVSVTKPFVDAVMETMQTLPGMVLISVPGASVTTAKIGIVGAVVKKQAAKAQEQKTIQQPHEVYDTLSEQDKQIVRGWEKTAEKTEAGDIIFRKNAGLGKEAIEIEPEELPANPLIVESKQELAAVIGQEVTDSSAKEYAIEQGYDGIIYKNKETGALEMQSFGVQEGLTKDAESVNLTPEEREVKKYEWLRKQPELTGYDFGRFRRTDAEISKASGTRVLDVLEEEGFITSEQREAFERHFQDWLETLWSHDKQAAADNNYSKNPTKPGLKDLSEVISEEALNHKNPEAFIASAVERLAQIDQYSMPTKALDRGLLKVWESVGKDSSAFEAELSSIWSKADADNTNMLFNMAMRKDEDSQARTDYDILVEQAAKKAWGITTGKLKANIAKRMAQLKENAKEELRNSDEYIVIEQIVKDGGLNKKSLSAVYSAETIALLSNKRPGLVTEKGTLKIDEVAQAHRFESAEELVEAILYWKGLTKEAEAIAQGFESQYISQLTEADVAFFKETFEAEKAKALDSLTKANKPKRVKGKINPSEKRILEGQVFVSLKETYRHAAKAARSAKQAIGARNKLIKNVLGYYGLTDAEAKKVSRKNPHLMTNQQFRDYLVNLARMAVELKDNRFSKEAVINLIEEKKLDKVAHFRNALGLPPINKMTTEQADQFFNALEQFHEGDVFLTTKQMRVVEKAEHLRGVKTIREYVSAISEKYGKDPDKMVVLKKPWRNMWDTLLAQQGDFWHLVVSRITEANIAAEQAHHDLENKLWELARAAHKSRSRSIKEHLLQLDERIFNWLEADKDGKAVLMKELTDEELALGHYIAEYFAQALEYLINNNVIDRGRNNYVVHIRKTFLENVGDKGFRTAIDEFFEHMKENDAGFSAVDDTGAALSYEKFFQFALERTGGLDPTQNLVRSVLVYASLFERKKLFDATIPELAILGDIVAMKNDEVGAHIIRYLNEYLNTKKGRKFTFGGTLIQGGRLDVIIRGLRMFTTMLYLAGKLSVGVTSTIGEQMAQHYNIGLSAMALGTQRMATKKGREIIRQYQSWVGRNFVDEITAPGKLITERAAGTLMGLFSFSTRFANKQYLLSQLTDAEWKSGKISTERLTQMRLDAGRTRAVSGASIYGSTSIGDAAVQFKSWAIPFATTIMKDIQTVATTLAKEKSIKPASKEAIRLSRIIYPVAIMAIFGSWVNDDDDSMLGDFKRKAFRELTTALQSFAVWFSATGIVGVKFLTDIVDALATMVALDKKEREYADGRNKGWAKLKRTLTPGMVKQFMPSEKKKKKNKDRLI